MKKNNSKLRRLGSVLLSIWLCISLMPASAFAIDGMPEGEVAVPEQEEALEVLDSAQEGAAEITDEDVEAADVVEEPLADPACEHELVTVDAVEATCEHTGHKAYRQCTKCGVIYDLIDNKEVDYQTLIIPVAAHKWTKTAEVPATPSANGKITYTCSVCGTSYDEETHYKAKPATAKAFTLDGNKLQFKTAVVKTVPSFMNNARISHTWIKAAKKKIALKWELAKKMKLVDGVIIMRKTGKSKVYKEIKRIPFKTASSGTAKWSPKTAFTDTTAKKKNTAYTYIVVSYFVEDGYTYISHCSDWASGQTTASKLKNAYKAKINKKSASMQYGGTLALKVTHSKPKKTFNRKSIRWYSDNTKVAKVSSKGKVTATGVGSTTIRARLASGCDVTCRVSVVGAFTPAAPKLKVDVANETSITLVWNKVSYAKSYDVYRSDDGLHWKSPVRVTTNTKKFTGLTKGHRYTFYVIAVNTNGKYTAKSTNSNVIYQKAVVTRRPTTVSGWPSSKSAKAGSTLAFSIKVSSPTSRKANLQMHSGKKWVNKKTITLPSGAGTASVKITLPNDWWGTTTKWRLTIPQNATSEAYTSGTLTVSSARKYQNPSSYVQIANSIGKHGYDYYVSKILVNSTSTKSDHIEALITTANKYKGDKYINGNSGAPGKGIDASGLVIQSCYGAGVDLWPISPATRPSNCVPKLMDAKLKTIKYTRDHVNMTRGDLIFFQTSKNIYGHVAIYLGYGKIIHASLVTGKVETGTIDELIKPAKEGGKYCYSESTIAVRRIFN
ncbi:MAG: C40 family peptidase [Mogibacterium sp.]|nr:C40 family peptidase [Mogibacterium sp.]